MPMGESRGFWNARDSCRENPKKIQGCRNLRIETKKLRDSQTFLLDLLILRNIAVLTNKLIYKRSDTEIILEIINFLIIKLYILIF